jgi:hypothetical protein
MSPVQPQAFQLGSSLATLRQVLDLISSLRKLGDPLTSAEDLRASIALLVQLGGALGIDRAWTDRVSSALNDERVFAIVLAIVQYVAGLSGRELGDGTLKVQNTVTGESLHVEPQALADWLPIVVQLISLLRQIRGAT